MSESLFERLGGQNAVNAAVDIFYRKMLTDDRVSYFFDDVDYMLFSFTPIYSIPYLSLFRCTMIICHLID